MIHTLLTRTKVVTMLLITFTLTCIFALPQMATASDVFDDEQSGSLRESLGLTGGYIEQIAQDENGNVFVATMSPNGLWCSTDAGASWIGLDASFDVGDGHSVASPAADTVLAVAGIALYRSTDACATWSLVDAFGDYDQSHMLADDGLVMIPKRNGQVAITEDDGVTINNYDISGTTTDRIAAFAASPVTDTYFTLIGEGGDGTNHIYKSTNRGVTWTNLGVDVEADVIALDQTDGTGNTIVVAGDDDVLRSTDGGATWTAMGTRSSGEVRGHITFSPDGSRITIGPEYTEDLGVNWDSIGNEATGGIDSFLEGTQMLYDVDYATNNTLWLKCGRGPCKSTDNGVTWNDTVTDLLGVTINDISQDDTKEVVWMAAQGGFVKSEDFYSSITAGIDPTWEFPIYPDAVGGGVSNINVTSAVWVDPDNTDNVLAAWPQMLYISDDAGVTWSAVASIGSLINADAQGTIKDIGEDSAGTLYAVYTYLEGDISVEDEIGGGTIMSTDGGVTWTDAGMANVPARTIAFDKNDNVLVGVGAEQDDSAVKRGLYFYNAATSTWKHRSANSSHQSYKQIIEDIEYIPAVDRYVAVSGETNEGKVLTSNDLSNNWKRWKKMGAGLPSNFWGHAVVNDPTRSNSVYVADGRPAGSGRIYKCTAGSGCSLYFTGLVDETFNTMLFDGLLTGSSLGVFSYQSKLTLSLKQAKVAKGKHTGKTRLTATLKDASTDKNINGRVVKFYKKNKEDGKYRFVKKRTVKKGKAKIFVTKTAKAKWYQARFAPKTSADKETYGTTAQRSNKIRVKK